MNKLYEKMASRRNLIKAGFSAALICLMSAGLVAQTFPTPTGFTLPPGKTIVITYDVDVNANACTPGTTPPANLSNQASVSGSNFATVLTNEPSNPAPDPSPTLTPFAGLTIGNQVYNDVNRNGLFDDDDLGINGVVLNLYLDVNSNNMLDAGDGAAVAMTTTANMSGQDGRYAFSVCPGTYIVQVAPSNFSMSGALFNAGAPFVSSPISGAGDPDVDLDDNDDNGDPVSGFGVATAAFAVAADDNKIDFGFKIPTQISINNVTLAEGSPSGTTTFTFTVSRPVGQSEDAVTLTVNTNVGTAASPGDFAAISSTVTLPATLASTTIEVLVNKDVIVEADETFTVLLTNPPAHAVLTDGSGLGTITNDDAATVTLSGPASQLEGNSGTTSYQFILTLDNPVQGGFMIMANLNTGTATFIDGDLNGPHVGFNFTGNAGETKTMTATINGDLKVELDETFSVSLDPPTGAPAGVTAGPPLTGTITNDDAATVSIAGSVSDLESQTPQVFSVTLSNPVDVDVTVRFNTANNTATTGDNDYNAIVNQLVTFNAGATTPQSVNVTVNDDNKVETNEIFDVSIGALMAGGRDVSLGTDATIGTILNDDQTILTLTAFDAVKNEGNTGTTPFIFRATLGNPVQGGFTIGYETNDGTATLANSDYVDNDNSLIFNGTENEFLDITVLVNGDLMVEPDETFEVALTNLSLFQVDESDILISFPTRTGTILNDEQDWGDAPDPTYPTLSTNNGARHLLVPGGLRLGSTADPDLDGQPNANATGDGADEDGVTLPTSFIVGLNNSITVTVSAACKLDAWIDWNRDGDWDDTGEQVFNAESLLAGSNALTIAAPVVPIGNSFARFRVSNAGGLLPTGAAPEGEVEDYEIQLLNRAISVNDVILVEGNAGMTMFNFTVNLNTPAGPGGVTFDIATQDNTATDANNDYEPKTLTDQSIPEGQSTYAFSVTVNGDNVVEGNETFFVNLTNVVGAGVADGQGTGIITNDDNATLTLSQPAGAMQNEGNMGTTPFTYRITLNNSVQGGFRVNYTTNNGTATTADNDYADNDAFLDFTGTAGEFHEFTVNVNGDTKVESDETIQIEMVSLSLTSVNPASVMFSGSPFTSTILNDDAATLTIVPVSQNEGTGGTTDYNFEVTLNPAVQGGFGLNFVVNDGTATDTDDFDVITTNPLAFTGTPGETHNIVVRVNADNKVEAHETFTVEMVSLSLMSVDPLDVTFSGSPATGTITNDDNATVTLTPAGGITQNEGNTGHTLYQFFATLNNPVQGSFTVAYTSNDGTATAGSDYINNDGIVGFNGTAGQSQPISILVIGDFIVEANETFTVALGAVMGAPSGVTTGSPQTGTILNDEVDFGDLPDPTYPTLLASNGARHQTVLGFQLGASLDAESNGQPSATAEGDDDNGANDEDGVTFTSGLSACQTATVTVNASAEGLLNAWVDFNIDGDFADPGEQIFTNQLLTAGDNFLTFIVPCTANMGTPFARFRFNSMGNLSFNGPADDGEVEDYRVETTQFSIDDPVAINEGTGGTTDLVFTVSRSNNFSNSSVQFSVTGGTATLGDNDFTVITPSPLNFTAGGDLTASVIVRVNGDTKVELNETVEISLSNPVNGSILDGLGVGTINNDDAAILSITSPTVTEGDAGTQDMTFNLSLSNPSDANVVVNFATMNGTATTADLDYQNNSGSHTFTPGQTMKQVVVVINGDCKIESNETFAVRLNNLNANGRNVGFPGGSSMTDGTGTINNNDAPPMITCPPPITIACDESNDPENTGMPVGMDNCAPITFSHTDTQTPGNCAGNYTITRTWKATDNTGDMSTCTQIITVVDNTPPTPVCLTNTVFIGAGGTYTLQTSDVLNMNATTDNCGAVSVFSITPATVTCAQLNQTINVVVVVKDDCGNSAQCTASITVQEETDLPSGWNTGNVGNANGSSIFSPCTGNNGAFVLAATGFSTSSSDVLHTAYQQICGNTEVIARVVSVSGGGWGGVMIRETLMPGSKKVALKTQLGTNIRREIRSVTNGAASILNSFRPQHTWLRLVRTGNNLVGYTSTNGVIWDFSFSTTIPMSGCAYVGIFSESINNAVTNTATFDNVSVTGSPAPLAGSFNQLPVAESGDQVQLYPNPTTGELTIDLDVHAGKPGVVQVFNVLGELVTQERLVAGEVEPLRTRIVGSSGVYTVVIQLDDHRIVRRVVVDPGGGK